MYFINYIIINIKKYIYMRNINNPYSSDYTHNQTNINNLYPDISNLPVSQSNFVIQPTTNINQ